jgi:4-hydroxybenzoate polyprenyltransferase
VRACLRLSRLDRPVGWQLLLLPCLMGLGLTSSEEGFWPRHALYALLFVVGAIAMRGAGCTYNDIVDRDIDAQVERTRGRPLPAGQISVNAAWAWLAVQCAVGLAVLAFLPLAAQLWSVAAIPLVATYPFMKRITWWPQAWLGLCFSWGALVAGAAVDNAISFETWLLFTGCVFWVIAYDTIYALQDIEDDALVGVRSTARLFGKAWKPWVACFYVAALFLWGLAATVAGGGIAPILALAAIGALLVGPLIDRADPETPGSALTQFKANVRLGLAAAAAFALNPGWITIAPYLRRLTGH